MKTFLIFLGGLATGVVVTLFTIYIIAQENIANDGLSGLTLFPEKGECLKMNSKMKSSEIEVLQVLAPNAALGTLKYYTDEKSYGENIFRNYDHNNEVVVLLVNYEGKTYYDDQKIDVTKKCTRQIGTYQYQTKSKFGKTVPAVVIESGKSN